MTVQSKKQDFLQYLGVETKSQATRTLLWAALRHNLTYKDTATAGDRRRFGIAFKKELVALAERYQNGVTENEHIGFIEEVAIRLSEAYGEILQGDCLRIGTVQKGLNLYLKILWCLDPEWPTPPHCPIDRQILQAACIYSNWTDLNSLSTYKDWIAKIKTQVVNGEYESLAEWELCTWKP